MGWTDLYIAMIPLVLGVGGLIGFFAGAKAADAIHNGDEPTRHWSADVFVIQLLLGMGGALAVVVIVIGNLVK